MWCNIVGVCVYISWMCCSDEQNIQMFLGNLGFLLLLILTLTQLTRPAMIFCVVQLIKFYISPDLRSTANVSIMDP